MNKLDLSRPLSWSSISSFEWNAETWAKKYVDGEQDPASPEMLFGNEIGTKIASDKKFLPEVLRYPVFEQKLTSKIDDILLIGYLDSFDPKTKNFYEYKTASKKTRWNNKEAQKHGQILFYLLLIWRNYKVPPEKIVSRLFYIPVHKKDGVMALSGDPVQSWEVRHTSAEVLRFAAYIKEVRTRMISYVENRTPVEMSIEDTLMHMRA